MIPRLKEGSEGTRLRQVSLQKTAEYYKVWDVNISRMQKIHTKAGIDYQPVSIFIMKASSH